MKKTIIAVSLMLEFLSCNTVPTGKNADSPVFFSVVNKDSAHIVEYRYAKVPLKGSGLAFHYSNGTDSFALYLDTIKGGSTGKFGNDAPVDLPLEKANYYVVNGTDYKVFKLIGDKDVTDGAFSLFISPDFGLLIHKSNTWRNVTVRCPEKDVVLMTLLYKIETDSGFFGNKTLVPEMKFKAPKVEQWK